MEEKDLTRYTKRGDPRVRKQFTWKPGPRALTSTVIHKEVKELPKDQQLQVLDYIRSLNIENCE
jgi:hypothetical protein